MRWWPVVLSGVVLATALKIFVLYPSTIEGVKESLPQTRLQPGSEPVLRDDGSLALSGYSLQPAGEYDDSVLQKSWFYKRWDFFSLFHPDLIVAFAMADLSYVGCM